MSDTEPPTSAGKPPRMLDGRYEIGELVGSGGMAEVWRAHDTRLGRAVAVKLLSGPSAREASMRRRIEREARALAALSHPNIVAVYDYGEAETPAGEVQPYLVMELVEGLDLHRYLETLDPLAIDEATAILRAVLSAVERAHVAGIVHGDLKPANVIFGSGGPKVGDFGVARILSEETGTTTVAATPTFAAPEVLRGERPGPASDIYSAACMAFQMLTGRPPYEGGNAWEIASKHLEDPVPSARYLNADVPGELDEAVRRGMAKNPKRRHDSARSFIDALSDVPATVRVTPPRVAGAVPPDATEALTGRPDLGDVALLGPFAGWWRRIRNGARSIRVSPRVLVIALVLLLPLVAALLLRDRGPELVAVPDVRELRSGAAAAQLRMDGFRADVSYRPVTDGEPDIVLETIPATGEMVELGTEIHIIASALARTPAPVVTEDDGHRGRGNGDRGKGKDDD